MKRAVAWSFIIPAIVVACASNEPEENTAPSDTSSEAGATIEASAPAEDAEAGPNHRCGDGHKDVGEECDDGNNASTDGCSPDCRTEIAGDDDVCPGRTLPLAIVGSSYKGAVSSTTVTAFDQYAGSCGGALGRERVYVVTPVISGVLGARVISAAPTILYARRSCDDVQTEASCDEVTGAVTGSPVRIAVTKDEPLYLFVDTTKGLEGDFTLDVEIAISQCGDGFAQLPEECDDGNLDPGDGCAADCTFEPGGLLSTCPGETVNLHGTGDAPRRVSFAGATSAPTISLSTAACTTLGPNDVYAVVTDIDGSMEAKLLASYKNSVLFARTECNDDTTALDCVEGVTALQNDLLKFPVQAGRTYYLVVDSQATGSGPYTLDVVVTPGACGNGTREGSEQCDDGNTDAGDGCAADCTMEPVDPASDACPGLALPLAMKGDGTYGRSITSSTAALTGTIVTAFSGCKTAPANDAVYAVTPPVNGRMTATVRGAYDAMIFVRNSCAATGFTDLACSSGANGNGAETVTVPVLANTPLYLVVDGARAAANGMFQLDVALRPAACGNNLIDGGEACDDGNAADGDGCSSTCQIETGPTHDTCANADAITLTADGTNSYSATVASGTTNLTGDQTFSTTCASAGKDAIYKVTPPMSGVLRVSVPTSSFNVSLGVRNTCTPSMSTPPLTCSNATSGTGGEEVVLAVSAGTTYYVIVDGPTATDFGSFTMNLSLKEPTCGDRIVSGAEACDDGNLVNGDGCSSTCTVEPLAGIDTCPGLAMTLIGTGSAPRTGTLTIDTTTLAANYSASCGGTNAEGVVVVTPDVNGTLNAKFTGQTFKTVLYARSTCADAKTELGCSIDAAASLASTREITIPNVVAGTPYYLFLDGYDDTKGIGLLNVTLTP